MIPGRLLTILICDCFFVPQSLLVAEAYKKRDISIWVDAVYHQVVIKGNFNYFQDMRSALPLSNSLFVDVANKWVWWYLESLTWSFYQYCFWNMKFHWFHLLKDQKCVAIRKNKGKSKPYMYIKRSVYLITSDPYRFSYSLNYLTIRPW